MHQARSSYDDIIDRSIRVCWQLDELFPEGTKISYERPHLPNALAATEDIRCLDAEARLALNHIRGNAYMNLFGFVEEYIIADTVQHAQAELFGDHAALRALLRFGEEEIKHQALFHRYCASFARDFGSPCEVLGSPAAVAGVILANPPMAVMLTTLHLELITQQHYTEAIKDRGDLDPLFCSLLKHHWLEESQHAQIDLLELEKMASVSGQDERAAAVDAYFGILAAFDGLLASQVEMDLRSLEQKVGREYSEAERVEIRRVQHISYRRDFLVMGLKNAKQAKALADMVPDVGPRIAAAIAQYSA
ncbi:MAG: diiron oxygenase [Nannocystaceae bacterium]